MSTDKNGVCAKCGASPTKYAYYHSIFDRTGIQACSSCVDEVEEMVSYVYGWYKFYPLPGYEAKFEAWAVRMRNLAEDRLGEWGHIPEARYKRRFNQ